MKISCSLSAFKGSLEAALDRAVALGFDQVDLICIPGFQQILPAEVADDPQAAAHRVDSLLRERNLRVTALNCGVPTPHDRRDAAQNAERLRQVRGLARFASLLNVGVLSFYPGYKAGERDPREVLAQAVETFSEWQDLGRAEGVCLAVEPHWNTPFESPQQIAELCAALPGLPLVADPSHVICAGATGCSWQPFFAQVAHVHLRDARPGTLCVDWGQGNLVHPGWLDLLHGSGYTGAVAIEYLAQKDLDHERAIQACAESIRAWRVTKSDATVSA